MATEVRDALYDVNAARIVLVTVGSRLADSESMPRSVENKTHEASMILKVCGSAETSVV